MQSFTLHWDKKDFISVKRNAQIIRTSLFSRENFFIILFLTSYVAKHSMCSDYVWRSYLTVLSIKTLQWLDILKGSSIWQRRDFNFSKLWKCSRCICYHDNTTEKSYCGWCQLQINEGNFQKTKKERKFRDQSAKDHWLSN